TVIAKVAEDGSRIGAGRKLKDRSTALAAALGGRSKDIAAAVLDQGGRAVRSRAEVLEDGDRAAAAGHFEHGDGGTPSEPTVSRPGKGRGRAKEIAAVFFN